MRAGWIWEISVSSLQYCWEFKTPLKKIKPIKHKKKKSSSGCRCPEGKLLLLQTKRTAQTQVPTHFLSISSINHQPLAIHHSLRYMWNPKTISKFWWNKTVLEAARGSLPAMKHLQLLCLGTFCFHCLWGSLCCSRGWRKPLISEVTPSSQKALPQKPCSTTLSSHMSLQPTSLKPCAPLSTALTSLFYKPGRLPDTPGRADKR